MPIKFYLIIILTLEFFCVSAQSGPDDTLCTPNPSKEAVALYKYLYDMSGEVILSGQQDSPWGIDEFAYIKTNTGKQPAIKGMDFIHQNENAGEVQKAINWWKAGGIPTIMWHWGAPTKGDGYEQSKMTIEIDRCFIEGTAEYNAFWAELKLKADLLQVLKDANVPVLWRPYHELNGNWFWWGKQGGERFKKLWITMFNYYVYERDLNNLIWVLCYTGSPDENWYPGDQYVDIAGADTYNTGDHPQATMYNKVKEITNNQFPIAYHECGIPPNPDQCFDQGIMWSWWMEWHTDWLTAVDKTYLNYVFNHEMVITLDEVPDIMAVYGGDYLGCESSIITPGFQVDSSEWHADNLIPLGSGTSATLSPQVNDTLTGTWTWSGLGTSGNSATLTIPVNEPGTITARFINSCGAYSFLRFIVVDMCPPTTIQPFIIVKGGIWQKTNEVIINPGQNLTFGPQPVTGGSWSWSGAVTGSSRLVSFNPDSSCTATVIYTNECGRTSETTFTVTVLGPTDVNRKTSAPSIILYPSPCQDFLTVSLGSTQPSEGNRISIYSSRGDLVMVQKLISDKTILDISGIPSGIYHLRLNSNGHEMIQKSFIKIN